MRLRQQVSTSGRRFRRAGALLLGLAAMATLGGCKNFLDPGDVSTRGEKQSQTSSELQTRLRLVVPILKTIDPIDIAETEFTAAEPVRAGDLKVVFADYVIGRADLVTISILELTPGFETVRTLRVSDTGFLSLPQLDEPVRADGLTERELQRAISRRYKEAGILDRATVSVRVDEARKRTFSAFGAVGRPGLYPIPDADFRVIDALVQVGGDVSVGGVQPEYLYVLRKISSETPSSPEPGAAPATVPATDEDPLAPRSEGGAQISRPLLASMQEGTAQAQNLAQSSDDEGRYIYLDDKPVLVGTTRPATRERPDTAAEEPDRLAPPADGAALDQVAGPPKQPPYQFGETLTTDGTQRIIRVPLRELKNGHIEYNIVIRPGDVIIVPSPTTGFYFMIGHVGSPGAYQVLGQRLTLTQAIGSARMLGPLAVPQKTDLVRRVGDDQLFVRVDLRQIFEGKQPNIYIKPDDEIRVGTDWYPPFLAAIRGAFRVTYGFGFLYDRNFAPERDRE